MERRSFLKRLGILAGASLIPTDKILAVTDFVEKKDNPAELGSKYYAGVDPFVNQMSIQRKGYTVTGSRMGIMFYDRDGNPSQVIWHEPQTGIYNK